MTERLSKLTNIQHIISQSKRLSCMPHDSQLLAKLDDGIKGLLSGQLATHCQIGKIEDTILIYYVDSPIWAYTFKMAKMNILATLNTLGEQYRSSDSPHQEFAILSTLTDIHIRVRPSIARPERFRKKRTPLPKFSEAVSKSITETADTLQDQELADQWREFGQNHCETSVTREKRSTKTTP